VHGATGVEIFDRGSRWKLIDQINAGTAQGNGRVVNEKTPLDPVRLLPSEAATLQSYPEGFQFSGGKGKQFQQIGNAVPPLLAQRILEALWKEVA
jgi:DNA (cytosine-5)-methyltransferase 1